MYPNQDILIAGGRISALRSHQPGYATENLTVVDGRERYIIPGLSDMHAHISTPDALILYLASGVTTVRDLWGEAHTLKMRDEIVKGTLLGPNLTTAGRIIDGAPPAYDSMHLLTDPDAADALVKSQVEDGYDFIKIYSHMTLDVFDAVMSAAKKYHIEVSGHIPTDVPIEHAIRSGMKTSEHLLGVSEGLLSLEGAPGLDLYIFYEEVKEFVSGIGRGEISLEDVVDVDKIQSLAELAAEHNTWFVPTLAAMRNFGTNPSSPDGIDEEWHRVMPRSVRDQWASSWKHRSDSWPMDARLGEDKVYALRLKTLLAIHKAGGKILVGTDAPVPGMYWGRTVIDEMLALNAAGLSNAEVLYAATKEAANYLGKTGESGEVSVGAAADLVVLNSNPLEDLSALGDIAGVIRAGRWLPNTTLDSMLNDLANRYAREENLFVTSPVVPEGFGTPIDFSSSSGDAIRIASKQSQGVYRIFYTSKESGSDEWTTAEIQFDNDTIKYFKGDQLYAQVNKIDFSWQLNLQSVANSFSSDNPTLILTDTPADVLLVEHLSDWLGVTAKGQAVLAWHCGSRMDCSATRPNQMLLLNLGEENIGSNLAIHHRMKSADTNRPTSMDYWASTGAATGRAVKVKGNPLRFETDNESLEWSRLR